MIGLDSSYLQSIYLLLLSSFERRMVHNSKDEVFLSVYSYLEGTRRRFVKFLRQLVEK